jgi:sporulation protein YlmC with PRC-barrel domain
MFNSVPISRATRPACSSRLAGFFWRHVVRKRSIARVGDEALSGAVVAVADEPRDNELGIGIDAGPSPHVAGTLRGRFGARDVLVLRVGKTQNRAASRMLLFGLNVYNEQNEKLGEINEVLLDKSGKATGAVIGVGGFLGMGEHDVMVGFDKLKWVNEPVRTTNAPPGATTGTATSPPARPARSANEMWYPDHAVMSATKDQLKAMQQFKYN